MTGQDDTEQQRVALSAAVARAALLPSVVGVAAVVAVLVFVHVVLAPFADPVLFGPWQLAMAAVPCGMAVLAGVHQVRRPDDREVVTVWLPFSRALRTLLNFAVIASPWVLLPHAEPLLRALMLMLYVWFIATEVLSNHDPAGLTWVALTGVPMSLSLFLFWQRAPYAVPLSIFLGLAGLSLYLLERLLQRGRAQAFEARLAAAIAVAAPAAIAATRIAAAPAAGLTARQVEVLRLLAGGLSNKEIARDLAVSPATVKTHVAQIIAITGAANRTGASMRARDLGLV